MGRFKNLLKVALCFTILFMVTGCGNKNAITSDDFKNKMEAKEFTVQDATNQFSNYDYIKQVYIALNDDYQIEFYEMADNDNAVSFYENNKKIFEDSKSSGYAETNISMGNNSKYTLKTNGKYKVVSRIDNTVIYLNVDDSNQSTIKDLLKDLGY